VFLTGVNAYPQSNSIAIIFDYPFSALTPLVWIHKVHLARIKSRLSNPKRF